MTGDFDFPLGDPPIWRSPWEMPGYWYPTTPPGFTPGTPLNPNLVTTTVPFTWPTGRIEAAPAATTDREPRLLFTIGTQRGGKSTKATAWLHRREHFGFEDDGYPRAVWNSDACRLAMHGDRYNRKAESAVYMVKRYAVESLLLRGHDVLVDGTHSTRTSIRRILEIREDAIPIVVEADLEVCKQRAIETEQYDLLKVLPRVHRQVSEILEQGVGEVIAEIKADIEEGRGY